jgi:hypothetical protein
MKGMRVRTMEWRKRRREGGRTPRHVPERPGRPHLVPRPLALGDKQGNGTQHNFNRFRGNHNVHLVHFVGDEGADEDRLHPVLEGEEGHVEVAGGQKSTI